MIGIDIGIGIGIEIEIDLDPDPDFDFAWSETAPSLGSGSFCEAKPAQPGETQTHAISGNVHFQDPLLKPAMPG